MVKTVKQLAAERAAAKRAADEAAKNNAGSKVPALSISAKREGFRRAGRAWSKDATVVKLSDLTDEQIAQIMDEPMLEVEEIEVEEVAE